MIVYLILFVDFTTKIFPFILFYLSPLHFRSGSPVTSLLSIVDKGWGIRIPPEF